MINSLFNSLAGVDPALAVFLVSMVPGIELRGGVPLGVAFGMDWVEVCGISLLGNLVPIPLVIVFGRYLARLLESSGICSDWIASYRKKVMSKSKYVQKYGPWGLMLFVGIPIPGTGVWTGSILALMMNLRMKKAIPAMLAGMLIACVIMSLGSFGVAGIVG